MTPLEIPPSFLAERQRQIAVEGWTHAHDDEHSAGEMLLAAIVYWNHAIGVPLLVRSSGAPAIWPWDWQWWKPKSRPRDLERAGALCLAERARLARRGSSAWHVNIVLSCIVESYNAHAAAG